MREVRKALGRNDDCHCGSGKKYKKCHWEQDQALARVDGQSAAAPVSMAGMARQRMVAAGRSFLRRENPNLIKTPEQIAGIRKAGRLTWELLEMLEGRIVPGVATGQIDRWVEDATRAAGATSAPLGYQGGAPTPFPKSVCTSINNVVCHGIPGDTVLEDGDIVNVDISPILNGYYGDSSRTFCVGNVSEDAKKLVRVTRECLELGIRQVRPGGFVGDIGQAIQAHAESNGFSVVRDFVGHGVGLEFHEDPQVPHFGRRGTGHPLLPGMVFTIEPMINAGAFGTRILEDGWTAITRDGSLSAQFEHTVLVTETGHEILTL